MDLFSIIDLKMKNIVFFSIFFFVSITSVIGQEMEVMALEYSPYPGSAWFSESGKINLGYPLWKGEKSGLILSPEYKFMSGRNHSNLYPDYYDQLSLRFAWQYKIDAFWRFQWIVMPSVTACFSDHTAFLFNNVFRVVHKTEFITYTAGIAYSHRYANNIITPVAGFMWQPNKQWLFTARLPLNVQIQHKINKIFNLGFELSGNGMSSMSNQASYGFLWIHERNAVFFSDVRLFKNLWFTFGGGYTLSRTVKTFEWPEKDVWTVKFNLGEPGLHPFSDEKENGLFLNMGIKLKTGI